MIQHHQQCFIRSRGNGFQLPNQPHTLWSTLLNTDNLEAAKDWLIAQAKHQDNSDVWSYLHHWDQHRTALIKRIKNQTFRFQPVSERAVTDALGQASWREMRCAEDRLLIRAIAQVLKPVILAATPENCVHPEGRGGLKQAVRDTQTHMNLHPKAHVFKSDVKSYYASIQHRIVYDQLCTLLPDEPKLCRLIWQSLQRTVERGGNYRDIEQGIPLGSSLSPLLAALYLIPLDTTFSDDLAIFYRRYMDDWVIIVNTRRQLRQTTKGVYAVLKSLRVDKHPDKTWIGRAKRGFDFLGFRITPTSIQPSAASVSRRDKKVARLYERGASKRRIGLYLGRWLVWGMLGLASAAGADTVAAPDTSCNIPQPFPHGSPSAIYFNGTSQRQRRPQL